VGSLVGSVVNTATSGFQAIMGTATAALGANAAKNQVVKTAEAVADAMGTRLGSAVDPRVSGKASRITWTCCGLRAGPIKIRSEFDSE